MSPPSHRPSAPLDPVYRAGHGCLLLRGVTSQRTKTWKERPGPGATPTLALARPRVRPSGATPTPAPALARSQPWPGPSPGPVPALAQPRSRRPQSFNIHISAHFHNDWLCLVGGAVV
ncbi:hypothetical protein GCM10010390_25430 [Streptomyces mordarskii]|uniref:Uncharacterized protein n=1 Tax=Streptomyces mordarskii TaxID=1226758 RepID=A0ABN1CML6_9ACTN